MSEPTCGGCRHWHYLGRPEAPPGPALLTGQEPPRAVGQCRVDPPLFTILPNGGQLVAYRTVPAEFPACSRHAPADAPELNHQGNGP